MNKMLVPIIIGSKSDEIFANMVSTNLKEYGIESEIRVASAHKSIHHLLEIVSNYEGNKNVHVYITIAGRSNALSAVIDANSIRPVIAYPIYSSTYGGADIFSSLRVCTSFFSCTKEIWVAASSSFVVFFFILMPVYFVFLPNK